MNDLDVMNPIKSLSEYIHQLFDLTSARINSLAIRELPPFYTIFDDILFKFHIFYKVIYEKLDIYQQDIEMMMDTTYIEFIQPNFLTRLARCIQVNIQLDIDPTSCFKPEQIHDFICLLRLSLNKMINDISEVYSWYEDRNFTSITKFFKKFLQILKSMKSLIENLEGEWYDNVEVVSDSIPPEANGEIFFDGEYADYDYIPPPANRNMF